MPDADALAFLFALESYLAVLPPRAKRYFESHADALRRRSDYRANLPLWCIFRVSPEKLGDKVVWQRTSDRMGAVYAPRAHNEQLILCIQTTYFIPAKSRDAGMAVSAWLNSLPVRAYLSSFAERARGSYFRHISWTVACLPLPSALRALLEGGEADAAVRRLIEISEALHENPDRPDAAALETELAQLVAQLYGLDDDDLTALRAYWQFVRV